jgi:hypothetical protein
MAQKSHFQAHCGKFNKLFSLPAVVFVKDVDYSSAERLPIRRGEYLWPA